jgi:hypothetical protein
MQSSIVARLAAISLMLMALVGIPSASPAHAATERCFAETKQCISGRFKDYWEQNGGLAVFGFPLTPAKHERNPDTGKSYLTQWFERNRFELHPEHARPYDVLLGRLGHDGLRQQGVDWKSLPRASGPKPGCVWFAETRHNVCDQAAGLGFKTYWQTHGLQDPQLNGYQRSLALFGLPLSEPRMETNASGDRVLTQWFERARFEWHPSKPQPFKVLLGLLGVGTTADCSRVQRITPNSAEGVAIGKALLAGIREKYPNLRQYGPFEFDEIRSIDRAGDWILFNASFKRAVEPAIFVLQATSSGYRFVGIGWSGVTDSVAAIRAELARAVPATPPDLIACLQTADRFLR